MTLSTYDAGGTSDGDVETSDSGDASLADASAVVTYTLCAEGVSSPDNNVFLDVSGFESGARLALAQNGHTFIATYSGDGVNRSLEFAPVTSTSAALVPAAGETMAGFTALCAQAPGAEFSYPAVMAATAGTLTYDEDFVFVAVQGVLEGDGGPCGAPSSPASFWLLCGESEGGAPPPELADAGPPPSAPELPAGTYTCLSQVDSDYAINGTNEYVAGGGNGTLTLAQSGTEVKAQYTGDTSVAGSLALAVTTATTAIAEANQSLNVPCELGPGTGMSSTPPPLSLTASSIAVTGSTLLLSFAGMMGATSSCPEGVVAGSLICAKQ